MNEHEKWLKQQVDEAMNKAERGESIYFTEEEVKQRMDDFKSALAEKSKK